jgi:antitoxin component YwqK of YwqJK toxin-antitoxin module
MAETYNLGHIENGVGTSWHDNGNEYIQITYVNGLATAYDEWHTNGTKYREHRYLNRKLNGVQRSWYEDGKKQAEYTYVNDVEHGNFHKWSRNGERLTIIYINGRQAVDCCVIA